MADHSLLTRILSGSEETSRLLIQDSVEVNGICLLKWGLCQMVKRCKSVNVILTDHYPEQWRRGLPTTDSAHDSKFHIKYLDVFNESSNGHLPEESFVFDQHGDSNSVIVIDNISTLLLQYKCPEICRLIHTLSSDYGNVVCLLHRDLQEEGIIDSLCHTMSSILLVSPCETNSRGAMCSVTHKRKSGMVIRKNERYEFIGKYEFRLLELEERLPDQQSDVFVNPSANLTFDLSLTEQQKESRSSVVLPYTKKISTGKILYEPDENDDLDESDPDEDLNI